MFKGLLKLLFIYLLHTVAKRLQLKVINLKTIFLAVT